MQKGLEEVWEKGRLVGKPPFPIDYKKRSSLFFIVFCSNMTRLKHPDHEALSIVPLMCTSVSHWKDTASSGISDKGQSLCGDVLALARFG